MSVETENYMKAHGVDGSWTKSGEIDIDDHVFLNLMLRQATDRSTQLRNIIDTAFVAVEKSISKMSASARRHKKEGYNSFRTINEQVRLSETCQEVEKLVDSVRKKTNTSPRTEEDHQILFTAQVLCTNQSEQLKKISNIWSKLAVVKAAAAIALENFISEERKDQILDSIAVCEALISEIPKKPNKTKHAVYVAYDAKGTIYGIALAVLTKKKQNLDLIATNPENLAILGMEKNIVRGVGSALVRHICYDITENRNLKQQLMLGTVPSAVPFYKKLGFESINKDNDMVLSKTGMIALLQKRPPTHVMQKKPFKRIDGQKVTEIIRAYKTSFFDTHLKGKQMA